MPIRPLLAGIASLALTGACSSNVDADQDISGPAQNVSEAGLGLTPIAEGLSFPWDMAFLPDGDMLVTERDGRLRLVTQAGLKAEPVIGVPEVYADNQGGLFDALLDPDFETNRTLYLSFAKGDRNANGTAVVSARLSDDKSTLTDVTPVFEVAFKKRGGGHFGGRMSFMDDGTLLLTLGEGYAYKEESQKLDNHLGSILRINTDGSAPDDNPFVGQEDALPEIWSYGHRNVQGLAIDRTTGVVYAHEHGPKGGDEINIIEPGNNYGWPVITYGVNYDGTIISNLTAKDGMEQPVVKWVPSIAPSDMTLYRGDVYPDWEGDLLVSALSGMQLRRVDLENGGVVGEEVILQNDLRYRFVETGPDGHIYVGVDDPDGGVYRLTGQ